MRLYSFSRSRVEVMAERTDRRLTRDLILDAVPCSWSNKLLICATCPLGGTINDIIEVPFPRASERRLINFRTFHCSTRRACSSSSEGAAILILSRKDAVLCEGV